MQQLSQTIQALSNFELVAKQPDASKPREACAPVESLMRNASRFSDAKSPAESPLHELSARWDLWFIANSCSIPFYEYKERLRHLGAFESVEGFLAFQRSLRPVRVFNGKVDFYYFRYGVLPLYDDPANAKGGHWYFKVKLEADYDRLWSRLLVAAVGGAFDGCEDFRGLAICVKEHFCTVSFWQGDHTNLESRFSIRLLIIYLMCVSKNNELAFNFYTTWELNYSFTHFNVAGSFKLIFLSCFAFVFVYSDIAAEIIGADASMADSLFVYATHYKALAKE